MSRDLFTELSEGMEAWSEANMGKRTLKTHKVTLEHKIELSPEEIKAIRYKLNISQAVFAQYLHAGVTTYQNWEQGKAKPNPQAVLLLRMLQKTPQTLDMLASLTYSS